MNRETVQRHADRLLAARRARTQIAVPPLDGPPASAEEAYAIQDAQMAALGPAGGWKVGASGPTAEPLCAPIPAALVLPDPAAVPAGDFAMHGIEAEVGFRIGADLPARDRDYSRQEVEAAIAAALPVIEIVDSRWRGWPRVDRLWQLADFQSNGALVHGEGRTDWHGLDFGIEPVKLTLDGRVIAEAIGGNAAGDPLRLVIWLANHCMRRCGGLRAGDIVTTGSCTGMNLAGPGTVVRASFPGLGAVEARFAV